MMVSLRRLLRPFPGASFVQFARHFTPQANVCNSLLVTRYNHLGSFPDRARIFATGAANAARSHLRIDQFPRAAFADRYRELAEHANHVKIGGIEKLLIRHE